MAFGLLSRVRASPLAGTLAALALVFVACAVLMAIVEIVR